MTRAAAASHPETTSKIYIRKFNFTRSFDIDRKLPNCLDRNTNGGNTVSITSDEWKQFCDKVDKRFRGINFMQKFVFIYGWAILFSCVFYLVMLMFTHIIRYDIMDGGIRYTTLIVFVLIFLAIIIVFFNCYVQKSVRRGTLESVRVLCETETSRLILRNNNNNLDHSNVHIRLQKNDSVRGYARDSDEVLRYPDIYIQVTISGLQYHYGGNAGTQNAQFATATPVRMDPYNLLTRESARFEPYVATAPSSSDPTVPMASASLYAGGNDATNNTDTEIAETNQIARAYVKNDVVGDC